MKSKKIFCLFLVILIAILEVNITSYAVTLPELRITSNNFSVGDKMDSDNVKEINDIKVGETLQLYAVIAHGNDMLFGDDYDSLGWFVDEVNLNGVVWTSSNTKVATVNNTGKVVGASEGKTTITAKYNEKNTTYEINVKNNTDGSSFESGKVQNIRIEETEENKEQIVKVSWDRYEGAEKYEIYLNYPDKDDGGKRKEKLLRTTSLTYTKLKGFIEYNKDAEYHIKLKAYKTVNGQKKYSQISDAKDYKVGQAPKITATPTVTAKPITTPTPTSTTKPGELAEVTNAKVYTLGTTAIFTWDEVAGAEGYTIKLSAPGEDDRAYDCTTNLDSIEHMPINDNYTAKVIAYKFVNGKQEYGKDYSNPIKFAIKEETEINNLKINILGNMTIYTWDKVEGATSYDVQVNIPGRSPYLYRDITKNEYPLTGWPINDGYEVQVRPAITVNEKTFYGDFSSIVKYNIKQDVKVKNVEVEVWKNTATYKWDEIEGATGYDLIVSNPNLDDRSETAENNTYIDKDMKINDGYTVKVRAFKTVNETKYYDKSTDYTVSEKFNIKEDGKVKNITADELIKVENSGNDKEDAATHNTKYLQKLVDEVSEAGGGSIFIPNGQYYFNAIYDKTTGKYQNLVVNGGVSGEYYAIKCKDNVEIIGESEKGTILLPIGHYGSGIEMFFFKDYNTEKHISNSYLINADFRNFTIDEINVTIDEYSTAGKGFCIVVCKYCDLENITVKNTNGTGIGLDCAVNSTIKNCTAINCGRSVKDETYGGGSGFGIGTGYSNDEHIVIENCYAEGNGKFGYFFEHQTRFDVEPGLFNATENRGVIVRNCTSKGNMYNYGGLRANDVIYENCISYGESKLSELYFSENCRRINLNNMKLSEKFDDVTNPSDYYYDAIYWARDNGITFGTGTGRFAPDEEMTRAQSTTLLWRAAGYPGDVVLHRNHLAIEKLKTGFSDVDDNESYITETLGAIKWAKDNKIIFGTNDDGTKFSPERACTRGEFVTLLYRYVGSPKVSSSGYFDDVTDTSEYYYDAVNWAASIGMVVGDGNAKFYPDDNITRKDAVTVLYRCMQQQ